VGGTLAQLAPPAELLARPVDPFVAGFVGRDRGYRALGFATAGALPVSDEAVVRLGAPLAEATDAAIDGWVLVVDDANAPQGWFATDPDRGAATVTADLLNLGGTLAGEDATWRETLDAALSAPSGRGVLVDGDGALAGTVTATAVVAELEKLTDHRRAPTNSAAAP